MSSLRIDLHKGLLVRKQGCRSIAHEVNSSATYRQRDLERVSRRVDDVIGSVCADPRCGHDIVKPHGVAIDVSMGSTRDGICPTLQGYWSVGVGKVGIRKVILMLRGNTGGKVLHHAVAPVHRIVPRGGQG